jgi:hypothetical protein
MGHAWFLNPKDRLIPGSLIGHKAIAVAIDHQVEICKHYNPTTLLDLALGLTPLSLRQIGAVIAPLSPGQ